MSNNITFLEVSCFSFHYCNLCLHDTLVSGGSERNEWKTSWKVESTSVFGQSVSFKRLNLYGNIFLMLEPEQA